MNQFYPKTTNCLSIIARDLKMTNVRFSTKKRYWILCFIGIAFFIFWGLSPSHIDENGLLHEPFFFFIPLGYLFIFVGSLGLVFAQKKGPLFPKGP
jgi:hypothetical protein